MLLADSFYYNNGKKVLLNPSASSSADNSRAIQLQSESTNIKYYTNSNNNTLGVSEELLVTFNSIANLDTLLDKYDLQIKSQISDKTYILTTTSSDLTLSISNELYLEEDVKYSHPNFIKSIKRK